MLERDAQRFRAVQVGMLMRAYRESFPSGDGGRGLTQEELLRRMASVDSNYGQRYSHTTVSRWESGATRPSRERLEVFGRALNLSQVEINGLVALAGFADPIERGSDDSEPEPEPDQIEPDAILDSSAAGPAPEHHEGAPPNRAFDNTSSKLRLGFFSCLVPAVAIIGGWYLWSALDWNALWIPIAYIGIVVGLRLAAGFQRQEGEHELCEFLCVSLFVLLTTPLLQSAMLNMDHYGFHSIRDWAGTSTPFMLALLVNLALATIAGAMFYGLQKLRYGTGRRRGSAIRRAMSVALPPIGLVYIVLAAITNPAVLVQLGVVFAFLSAAFVALLVLNDPDVAPQEGDRRFLLWSLLVFGGVMAAIGGVSILGVYLVPSLPAQFPDYNMLYSWDTDFARLGISPDEVKERFNVGYLWHATAIFVYMVFVVGAKLFVTIYSWESDHTSGLAAGQSPPGPDGAAGRPAVSDRVRSLLGRARPGSRGAGRESE